MSSEWIKESTVCKDKRGNEYIINAIATDIQTGDKMAVYTQRYGEELTFCCPVDAFAVSFAPSDSQSKTDKDYSTKKPQNAEDRMTRFFETDDFDEKVKLLKELYIMGQLTDNILDNLAAALDVVIEGEDLNTRYDQLKICIETRARYESGRLRSIG